MPDIIASFSRLKKMALTTLFSVLLISSAFCQGHQDWSYNLSMYEVNIRQYTDEGTFNAFTQNHLYRLEDLGAGILWIMPVHPIGQENRFGDLGSYYSVQDFRAVNPNFGTLEDFKTLVQEANNRGMYVILDWVANHTSWDNVLTEEHPEWYVTNDQGEFIPPPGTNWSDVIELDYSKRELRDYMIETMKFWIDSTGIDGFRFDAVDFVPDSFWSDAIDSLKSHKPDIFLLAESDGIKWHELGFDMTFAWGLYGFDHGVLLDIAAGEASAPELATYASNQVETYGADAYRMYFTSNHDINSWEGTTTSLFGDHASQFAVFTATIHGMPLIYSGQEAGLNKQLAFFYKDEINWRDHPNKELYTTLLHLKRNNKALWNGFSENEYKRIFTSNFSDTFAYLRKKDGDRVLTILNLSSEEIVLSLNGTNHFGTYQDVFSEEIITFGEETEISIPGFGYKVYQSGGNSAVSIEGHEEIPAAFSLSQNYPNPFNPGTVISYQLSGNSSVELNVFDALGRKVATLVNKKQSAGNYSVNFDGRNLSSGMYWYRLEAGNRAEIKKMTLIK